MRYVTRTLILACVLLASTSANAQSTIYLPDTTVKVFANGNEQTLGWCGGFNNPQFTMGDLNHDGLPDLVVFENNNSLRTFINKGSAGQPNYRYAPEYALNFPALYNFVVLTDYNRDGIPDLYHQGSYGFAVYRGYYNAKNQLCFTFYEDIFYSNYPATHGPANAFNNPGDIPGIVDVDSDGDIDIVSYDINGGWMNYYRNMQVERGLPADTIRMELWDLCWGKVYQGFWRTHTLQQNCDANNAGLIRNPGSGGMEDRRTHQGNTPCLFDYDLDGDYDYLDGSISFNEMTFLRNGRIPYNSSGPDTMMYQDTTWQNSGTGGTSINLSIFPAAYNIDIDQDGKKDILVAPNFGASSMNHKNIWFYKNLSTPGSPSWLFQSDSFLVDESIDLGTAAYPTLFDYNKDGKLDLIVGSSGFRQPSGLLRSKMSYYQNTGTVSHPVFTRQNTDLLGTFANNFVGAAPATGDIDNDGKADMIIGHTDGRLTYYKNMAASNTVTPDWQLTELVLTDMNGDTINSGGYSAPFIYDLDKDGKPDLIIGCLYGTLSYYQNVSTTPGVIRLKLITEQLGQVKVDPIHSFENYSTPYFGRIDSTGVDYLLIGSGSGNIYQYTGFQSGDTAATYTLVNGHYSFIDTIHNLYNHMGDGLGGVYSNHRSAPVVGDIIGDGSYEMLVGEQKGGIALYKFKFNAEYTPEIGNEQGKVNVYPNPANDMLTVSWSGVSEPDVQVNILNMEGQYLYTSAVPSSLNHAGISLSMLPSGMYICVLQSGVNRYYNKFTVIR